MNLRVLRFYEKGEEEEERLSKRCEERCEICRNCVCVVCGENVMEKDVCVCECERATENR